MSDYGGDDVVKVERQGDVFIVKHYPNKDTARACCRFKVEITDKDRARPVEGEKGAGSVSALHRAYLAIEKKHGRA